MNLITLTLSRCCGAPLTEDGRCSSCFEGNSTAYMCVDCSDTFHDFPAASNHELASEYNHLTLRVR